MKLIATHKHYVKAKYTERPMVSGLEGEIQSKILKNVNVYFETYDLFNFHFKILILLDLHNLILQICHF